MSTLSILAAGAMEGPEPGVSRPAEAVRLGDLAAFEQLIRQYERLVLVTALRLLGDLGDAQDVSQEVFLKLYKNLSKVENARLASWLYRVTVNACHDLRRKRPPSVPMEEAAEIPARGTDPQQGTVEAERRRVLTMSLRMLSEKERAALVLRDLEGLSTEEVARVLGSSEATVRSQVSKARVKVKDFVERYFPEAFMNCSVWEERIALYQGGDLPAGQAAEVERHLGECTGCQVFAGGMKEGLAVLNEAHRDTPDEAHFTAVRARVMAEIERSRRPVWRRVLAWSTVAAAILVLAGAARLYRTVPAPPIVALARPPAPLLRTPAVRRQPRRPVATVRQVVPRPSETVTIKLLTDNPDVVIYWIADRKGE